MLGYLTYLISKLIGVRGFMVVDGYSMGFSTLEEEEEEESEEEAKRRRKRRKRKRKKTLLSSER